MAKSVDPDQTAPIGVVCAGSTLFASILNSLVLFVSYLQQTTSADKIFQMHFFLELYGLNFFMLFMTVSIMICLMYFNGLFCKQYGPISDCSMGAV